MFRKRRKEILSTFSGLAVTLFSLRGKIASYPANYAKRAGELIAHGARSLRQSFPQRKKRKSGKPNPQ
jgi:hypothetical protein